jgi:hypothetical protein
VGTPGSDQDARGRRADLERPGGRDVSIPVEAPLELDLQQLRTCMQAFIDAMRGGNPQTAGARMVALAEGFQRCSRRPMPSNSTRRSCNCACWLVASAGPSLNAWSVGQTEKTQT